MTVSGDDHGSLIPSESMYRADIAEGTCLDVFTYCEDVFVEVKMAVKNLGIVRDKRIWWVAGSLLVVVIVLARLCFPPPPSHWNTLRKGMLRSDVLSILDQSTLELVNREIRAPIGFPQETWRQQYWAGQWTIRCLYDREGDIDRLYMVTIKFESALFPRLFRMRHYP